MSKSEKLLARLLKKPPPSDFTWDELCAVLKGLGYRQLKQGKTGGSRRKFFNDEKVLLISCHEPHPRSEVDKGCLAEVAEHLKTNGFIKEQDS